MFALTSKLSIRTIAKPTHSPEISISESMVKELTLDLEHQNDLASLILNSPIVQPEVLEIRSGIDEESKDGGSRKRRKIPSSFFEELMHDREAFEHL
jgi:hypothetical protein